MAKKVLIKIRSKPTKPQHQKSVRFSEYISDGDSLEHIVNMIGKDNLSTAYIIDHGGWNDTDLYVEWTESETVSQFNERMKVYEQKLAEWQKWYDENEELILKEKARRKEVADAKKAKELAAEEKRYKKRIKEIEKEKAKLDKELDNLSRA